MIIGSRSSSPTKSAKMRNGNSSLSRAGSMNSINLDTWDLIQDDVMDDKDKRIRELEETLRKQKELMEILQRKLNDTPGPEENLEENV